MRLLCKVSKCISSVWGRGKNDKDAGARRRADSGATVYGFGQGNPGSTKMSGQEGGKVRRVSAARTVVLAITVASVRGARPLMGFASEIEGKWRELKAKFAMRAKDRYKAKVLGKDLEMELQIDDKKDDAQMDKIKGMTFMRRGSEHGSVLSVFKEKEKAAARDEAEDVFSPNWRPPKFDVNDPKYGRPKEGSLTERRGIAAGHHIGKEIITLCEVITEYGLEDEEDGSVVITFGHLFQVYQYISDKVVGMLLRARKHGLVAFNGEMLFQRRDEEVPIFLLKPLSAVRRMYAESDDPAYCLSR